MPPVSDDGQDSSFERIRQHVVDEVKGALDHQSRWDYHIAPVVDYSMWLGQVYRADLEVLELAALLHDLTRMKGDKARHHVSGAEAARSLLIELKFREAGIQLVCSCILNHRGSIASARTTVEEKIIASADGMAHILHPLPMFFCCFRESEKNLGIEDAREWILKKIERSFEKVSLPEARERIEQRYVALRELLGQARRSWMFSQGLEP